MSKPRVLWVEDSARFELANLLGPIYASNKYELVLAEDATTAARYLHTVPFDAVIMDIRIPPGRDPHWAKKYERAGADKASAQLGLALLMWLFHGNGQPRPEWAEPEKFAVFSVEEKYEIGPTLEDMRIVVFEEKRPGLRDTALLDLIERVLRNSNGGHAR